MTCTAVTPNAVAWSSAAVSTSHPDATEAAVGVLRGGGGAVDAAVAAAWALAVCEPSGSGLGGHACLLVATPDGQVRAVDGPGRAPAAARRATITAAQQRRGVRATTVPTMPAVLGHAHARWGRLPWAQVLQPAIALAAEGFSMTAIESRRAGWVAAALRADPETARTYLAGGRSPRPGAVLRLPALAATLRAIARHGADDLYQGALSQALVRDQERRGGLIGVGDLSSAASVREADALVATLSGGLRIATLPAPGGAFLLLALAVLDQLVPDGGWTDPEWTLAAARATRAAQAARDGGDPNGDPSAALDPELVRRLADRIRRTAPPWTRSRTRAPHTEEPADTTHLCVADSHGTTVSMTSSIQSLYGAKVACAELGFLYNNYLRTCTRSAGPYRLSSACRPRSNAAPTIALDRRGPLLIAGSAGSRRITSSLVHVLSGVLDRGMSLSEAVAAPRSHLLAGGGLWIERPAWALLDPDQRESSVRARAPHDYAMGAVHALHRAPGGVAAAADPRRGGLTAVLETDASPQLAERTTAVPA